MTAKIRTAHPLADVMDSRGMLPADWFCLRCGKKLNADGGHPAELYAGTWNGLCYACTSARPFVEKIAALDGCLQVSWPPNCPSYRRDRQRHLAYADCENCKGLGATGYHSWTRAAETCKPCFDRYLSHPLRRWDDAWWNLIRRAAEARFQARLDAAAGTPKRTSQKRRLAARAALPADTREAVRKEVLADYERIMARHMAHADRLQIYAWAEPKEVRKAA